MEQKELIIIGGGASGLTASIFAVRRGIDTLVISIEMGGQTAIPANIANYPGFENIQGSLLMERMRLQAKKNGVNFAFGKVSKIEKLETGFEIKLSNGSAHRAKAVILAYGKAPRTLGITGEDAYMGNGIFTSTIHDPNFYIGKTIGVIGGGNSAFGTALECVSDGAMNVYIINRTENFRGDEKTLEKIKKTPNITFLTNKIPHEFVGDGRVLKNIITKDAITGVLSKIDIDAAFVNIGLEVKNDFCSHIVKLNQFKEIEIDQNCRTGTAGLFACGDATSIPFKQTIISAGEGAKAAIEAYKFLKGDSSRTANDWTH